MKHQELLHLSLVQARDEIEHLTVTPSELLDAYLERLHEKEPAYNAYVTVHEEAARQAAEGLTALQAAGLPLGPLHGIPIALKDNIDLKGFRSTASSKIRSNHVASRDATVAARLKSAGAVIIGHTNMHEFAWGGTTDSPHFGASHNPWDLERYCAGSSGGSGAAVAGGTALGALGTDTGGSVRLPAAVNGIVGMRPTIGRVPNTGIIPCGWTMDTCGPMTRSVRDNAVMLGVIAGHDFKDPGCSEKCTCDYTADLELGVNHLRIGMIPQLMHRVSQPDVDAGVEEAANVLRSLGAEIVACRFDYLDDAMTAWLILNSAEGSAYHQRDIRARPEDYGGDVRTLLAAGEFLPATFYLQAMRLRQCIIEEFRAKFREVDAFLFPTIPCTALKLSELYGASKSIRDMDAFFTCIASLTGLPALNIPCGLDHEGLPIGMQLLGRPFDEATLYRIGAAFETAFNLYEQLPAFH